MTLSLSERTELRELAKKATPGPWEWEFSGRLGVSALRPNGYYVPITDSLHCTTGERNSEVRNGKYIAAAHPLKVQALLDALDAADLKVATLEQALSEAREAICEAHSLIDCGLGDTDPADIENPFLQAAQRLAPFIGDEPSTTSSGSL